MKKDEPNDERSPENNIQPGESTNEYIKRDQLEDIKSKDDKSTQDEKSNSNKNEQENIGLEQKIGGKIDSEIKKEPQKSSRNKKPDTNKIAEIFSELGKFYILSFEIFKTLLKGQIHFRNTMQQMAFVGTDSLPIVILTGLSIGMVFSLQVTGLFQRYGANSVIGAAVAVAIVRELGPLFTGVVVAGRIGAAITAELGSMKVTEQINALLSMAVSPLKYLAVPRVLSCMIMVPLLNVVAIVVGIAGGLMIAVLVKGVIMGQFIDSIRDFVTPMDLLKSMLKASIFGVIVALVSCYKGINTGEGAQGVGISTTSAVVISLITIFVADFLLSSILFAGKM